MLRSVRHILLQNRRRRKLPPDFFSCRVPLSRRLLDLKVFEPTKYPARETRLLNYEVYYFPLRASASSPGSGAQKMKATQKETGRWIPRQIKGGVRKRMREEKRARERQSVFRLTAILPGPQKLHAYRLNVKSLTMPVWSKYSNFHRSEASFVDH